MKALRSLHFSPRTHSLLLSAGALAALLAAAACGGGGEPSGDGDGDGDGDASSGGMSGDGDTGSGGVSGDGDGDGDVGSGGVSGDGDGDGDVGSGGMQGDGDGDVGTGGETGTGGTGSGGEGLTENYNCDPASGDVPLLGLEPVVEHQFSEPVLVTHAGDERLFVLERSGRIHVIESGAVVAEPFLDLSGDVLSQQSEQGLLGLAFHPNFKENGLFYVYYVKATGGTGTSTVEEYSIRSDNPNQGDLATVRVIFEEPQPEWNHNGGTVAFGPDNMLYLGLGDGGGGSDPDWNGQTVTTHLGKLLRFDINGRDAGEYSIPSGNLVEVMGEALPEIYSYGLRNPYRYTFDGCTGDLYIGDVGQGDWEEVTIVNSGTGQLNYGWATAEGLSCHFPQDCDMTGITMPQIVYANGDQGAAVIGGSVYRGSEIPGLRGQYIYSDAYQGQMWRTTYDSADGSVTDPVNFAGAFGGAQGIVSIQNGADGEIYVTNRGTGQVLKLVEQVL